jgi:hypothetical protein
MFCSPEAIKKISEYKYGRIGLRFFRAADDIIKRYEAAYEPFRSEHSIYRRGWHASFTNEHRFMNRVIMQMFEDGILPAGSRLLDIGTYDGMLPAVLRKNGIDAQGWDAKNWLEMWSEVGAVVNKPFPGVDVVTMLNYCHNWRPDEIKSVVSEIAGNKPRIILMDREIRTPHVNNALWLNESVLAENGIVSVKIPGCRQSVWSDRDLLICEAETCEK